MSGPTFGNLPPAVWEQVARDSKFHMDTNSKEQDEKLLAWFQVRAWGKPEGLRG